jgi:hypothetical protein
MNKYSALLFLMIFSFLFGDANVLVRHGDQQEAQGEFIGTYMNHVHILMGDNIYYYACDDIISITSTSEGLSTGIGFSYDCSKNTVTADILFPPELDPMTGEMTEMLPDVFNPDIPKPAAKVEAGSVSTEEDIVVIDGVKYVRELIKDQNDTDEREIWNKKIPPSLYLEELSKEKEQRSRFGSYALGYLSLGSGILILTLTDEWGMGTIFIAGGLFVASRPFRNSPMTDAGKQFEKVKNIQDNNEIERLAYESLVSLASTSRIKKNEKDSKQRRNRFRNSRNSSPKEDLVFILLTALVSTAIEENKKNKPEQNIQTPLTIEEKALDNYLTQKIIL